MQDLLAGQVDAVMIDCATGIPFIASNRARALCVLSEARSPRAQSTICSTSTRSSSAWASEGSPGP